MSGTLSDGVYGRNTTIKFCRRTDGDKNNSVSLPSAVPFYLLAYESAKCQQVKWAIVSVEWIRFDNEENHTADSQGGTHPYGAHDHKIHYCYYKGKWFLFIIKMMLMSTTLEKSISTWSLNLGPH